MKFQKILNNLPESFLERTQFCLWKYEQKESLTKPSKVPYFVHHGKIMRANIKDSAKWISGFDAIKIAIEYQDQFSGIGFIITRTNLFGLDLDNCLDHQTKQLSPWAQTIVNKFAQTYIEISPSGKGIRILGKGNIHFDRNKSPLNSSLEVYNGHSVRYLTITGDKFRESTTIYQYKSNDQQLLWLKKTFFTCPDLSNKKIPEKKEQQFLIVKKKIEQSKDAKLFFRYQSNNLINYKSASEDDWHFCLLILRYMREANAKLLQEFLMHYRYRDKFKRKSYLDVTIRKVIEKAKNDHLIGKDYTILTSSNPGCQKKQQQSKIKKQDILKYCNMLDLFTIRRQFYPETQEILVKKNDHNFIKFYTNYSFSAVDLDNYLAILQFANLDLCNEPMIDPTAKGDLLHTVKVILDLPKLSKILHKKDGGRFRRDFLTTVRKMSRLYFEYRKVIDKQGNYVIGGSNLLSWYSQGNPETDIPRIIIGINPFAWHIMKNGQYNYCLINTKERFQLPTLQQRLLYFYLCRKVIPGLHYFCTFDTEHLSNILWGNTKNKHTNKKRKRSIRQICQELYQLQEHLTDFTIKLVQEKSMIQGIRVKRHKALLIDS